MSHSVRATPLTAPEATAIAPIGSPPSAERTLTLTQTCQLVRLVLGDGSGPGALTLHTRTGGNVQRMLCHLLVSVCDGSPLDTFHPSSPASTEPPRLLAALPRRDAPAPETRADTVFRREADYWLVSFGGRTVRLRDSRGLGYLATLLYRPGREIHVTDVVATGTDRPATASDATSARREIDDGSGVGPDPRANAAYRRRLVEIDDALTEAEPLHDLGQVARLRREQTALKAELLAAACGRRSGTHGERARLTVTKGIAKALARLAAAHPPLEAHLRATIRRGYYCAYRPDPRHPIVWEA